MVGLRSLQCITNGDFSLVNESFGPLIVMHISMLGVEGAQLTLM